MYDWDYNRLATWYEYFLTVGRWFDSCLVGETSQMMIAFLRLLRLILVLTTKADGHCAGLRVLRCVLTLLSHDQQESSSSSNSDRGSDSIITNDLIIITNDFIIINNNINNNATIIIVCNQPPALELAWLRPSGICSCAQPFSLEHFQTRGGLFKISNKPGRNFR